jgi:hypothetical protein
MPDDAPSQEDENASQLVGLPARMRMSRDAQFTGQI